MTSGESAANIVVSFHGIGASFRGLLAVSAYFRQGEQAPIALTDDVLRISYEEDLRTLEARFDEWLEKATAKGIELWRRTLG